VREVASLRWIDTMIQYSSQRSATSDKNSPAGNFASYPLLVRAHQQAGAFSNPLEALVEI
jgi:hypothetical protein